MSNELITREIDARVATDLAREMFEVFREASAEGAVPTIGLLDSARMKRFGRHLVMLDGAGPGALRVIHAGADVPDDDGRTLGGHAVEALSPSLRLLLEKGAQAARGRDSAALVVHRAPLGAAIHRWEVLFLPLADRPDGPRSLIAVLFAPLEHKHSFLRTMLDAMPQAALVVETSGGGAPLAIAEIIAANAGAVRLLGHPSMETLLAAPLGEAFYDLGPEQGWMKLVAEMQPGSTARFEYGHRQETGVLWLDVQVAPFGAGMMLTLSDISDLKRTILDLDHQRKALLEEVAQRRTLEEELWALAHVDPLTGLPNRRAFQDDAQATLIAAQTLKRPCAMISIDIDHFKRVNDTHGHGAGDLVLRRVADILKAPLRPEVDFAARMGGEEFSVLLPDTEMPGARAFGDMLRNRVEHTVVIAGDAEIRPTISLGVAMMHQDGTLDDLLQRSDRALYAAKRAGRNRVMTEDEVPEDDQAAA